MVCVLCIAILINCGLFKRYADVALGRQRTPFKIFLILCGHLLTASGFALVLCPWKPGVRCYLDQQSFIIALTPAYLFLPRLLLLSIFFHVHASGIGKYSINPIKANRTSATLSALAS